MLDSVCYRLAADAVVLWLDELLPEIMALLALALATCLDESRAANPLLFRTALLLLSFSFTELLPSLSSRFWWDALLSLFKSRRRAFLPVEESGPVAVLECGSTLLAIANPSRLAVA